MKKEDSGLDINAAEAYAYAEKPFHDAAEDETLGLDPAEKDALKGAGSKIGDRAARENIAEREKSLIAQLRGRLEKLGYNLSEKGSVVDAEIIQKLMVRLDRYVAETQQQKTKYDEESGERQNEDRFIILMREKYGMNISIPVTHQKDSYGGGWYNPGGVSQVAPGDNGPIPKTAIDHHSSYGNFELVNYGLSPDGETEFYRSLGILGPNQDVLDLPQVIREKKIYSQGQELNPLDYTETVPTDVEGVTVEITNHSKDHEKKILLAFGLEFHKQSLAQK